MNERITRRTQLNLTQTGAARMAGISLATWRRWEENPDSVRQKTRSACERILATHSEYRRSVDSDAHPFAVAWHGSARLTPRQAYAIAIELDRWAELQLEGWINNPVEPLHEVLPFAYFDIRIMMLVGESRAWAAAVQERCRVVAEEIESGTLPFDRPGPLIDEVLVGAALSSAESWLAEIGEDLDNIPSQANVHDEQADEYRLGDDDWDIVSGLFDDACRWDEWRVPIMRDHSLLPALLAERHPYRWFDRGEGTGRGYLRHLAELQMQA